MYLCSVKNEETTGSREPSIAARSLDFRPPWLQSVQTAGFLLKKLSTSNLYYMEIKKINGEIIFKADVDNIKDAVKEAVMRGANLRCAYLIGADLRGANLEGAKNIPHIPLACPSEGAFTAWKKVAGKLVELVIPADARRSSATSDKCRCDKAKVISITDISSNEQISEITNFSYVTTLYKVGEMVYPDAFDENRLNECSNGIHFFIDKRSAINY